MAVVWNRIVAAGRASKWCALSGVCAGLMGVTGCGGDGPAPAPEAEVARSVVADPAGGTGGETNRVTEDPPRPATDRPTQDATPVSIDPRFGQSFVEAALTDAVPDGAQLPPPQTVAGKSTAKVRLAVEQIWERVQLVDPRSGQPYPLGAVVSTGGGDFEITLDPNLAPNHVRNFLALVRVGYFDGLCFERTVRQQAGAEGESDPLEMVTFGCPAGTGESGRGHVGYFLLPEFSEEVRHEAGTVGFWRGQSADSAGCRLYVTLGPAPVLDGNFTVIGRVTRGLDVVRAIASGPTLGDQPGTIENEIPRRPVEIRTVTVRGGETDLAVGADGQVE